MLKLVDPKLKCITSISLNILVSSSQHDIILAHR